MEGAHTHGASESNAGDWDERYRGGDSDVWSGHPNGVLLAEISGLVPGRALDLGCGEGADAIWLASQGWRVTGVDISQVALDRAARAASQSDVTVDWVCADIVAGLPAAGVYDLVSAHYPALRRSENNEAIKALLTGVAPGGTLLVVGHAPDDGECARSHGFDPDDYVQPSDVAVNLDDGWTIEVDETRQRASTPHGGSPHSHDTVLKARRDR